MTRNRIAALVAAPIATAVLVLAGAGAAAADTGSYADHGGNSGVVSNWGSSNLLGSVHGNALWNQQTATGAGAHNTNDTTAVNGNTGVVTSVQRVVDISFGPVG